MSRLAKQFLYGLFYLAVFAGFASLVYFAFVRPAPSCTNSRQDAGEEGVDCGGVCSKVCVPSDIRDIQIPEPVWIFKSKGGVIELLAKIQNPNVDFSARTFDYRIDLYDENDALVGSVNGSSYIYASDIKYLTAIESIPGAENAVRGEVVIMNPAWGKAETFSRPTIGAVENLKMEQSSTTMMISGRITNRDSATLPRADIVAIFFGSYGSPIGISRTELDSFAPNEQRQFSILHPAIYGAVVDKTQIYIYGLKP